MCLKDFVVGIVVIIRKILFRMFIFDFVVCIIRMFWVYKLINGGVGERKRVG